MTKRSCSSCREPYFALPDHVEIIRIEEESAITFPCSCGEDLILYWDELSSAEKQNYFAIAQSRAMGMALGRIFGG